MPFFKNTKWNTNVSCGFTFQTWFQEIKCVSVGYKLEIMMHWFPGALFVFSY